MICISEPLASSRRSTGGRAGRLEQGGKSGLGLSLDPKVLAVLEHVQERLGERSERTALITGQPSDLLSKELVSLNQKSQTWSLPPERLELLNVRDRPILDRKLKDDQVLQSHKETVEAVHELLF